MHRSILSATFIFVLAASTIGVARAEGTVSSAASATTGDSAPSAAPADSIASTAPGDSVASAATPDSVASAATPDSAGSRPPATSESAAVKPDGAAADSDASSADEAAQPTAGADLAMWNITSAAALPPTKPTSRLQRLASGIVNRTSAIASSLTRSAMRFIGTPYVFGGTRSTGFDCSGYVQHVFAMLGFRLPRTADAQYDVGHRIAARIEPGDLVFFHTYAPGVSHVGIYLGKSKFIHSSSSHGVSIASLHDSYWAPRYLGAKRVFTP